MMRRLGLLMLLLGLTHTALAAEIQWQAASQALTHLDAALAQAKKKIQFTKTLPVAFPQEIPAPGQKAYADFIVLQAHESYAIEAATQPACDLRKTCMLGSLILQKNENPTIYYDRENREMTTPVTLRRGIHGYYTHGFALGDFWPARLEWRYGEVLYTLSWQGVDDQEAFIKMANSLIDQMFLGVFPSP